MEMAVETWGLTRKTRKGIPVDNLYLRIPWGSSYCLLGPPGAGKTEICKLLLGIKKATAGGGFCLGFDLTRESLSIRERLGYVEENPVLYSNLRVREMVDLCRSFYGPWQKNLQETQGSEGGSADKLWQDNLWREETLWIALRQVGVEAEDRVYQLSSAHKSLLALLLALAPRPELLIVEEPSLQYDICTRGVFFSLLQEQMQDLNCAVLITSRWWGELERQTDTVGLLSQGRLQGTLSSPELSSRLLPEERKTHIRLAFSEAPPEQFFEHPHLQEVRKEEEGTYLLVAIQNSEDLREHVRQFSPQAWEELFPGAEELLALYSKPEEG